MELTEQQEKIVEWVREGTGHAIINALAGSGKTSTLLAASTQTTGAALFCAFNKSIQQEIAQKLYERNSLMESKTIHSLGYGMVRNFSKKNKLNIDNFKYANLAESLCEDIYVEEGYTSKNEIRNQNMDLVKVFNILRACMVDMHDAEQIWKTISYYGLTIPDSFDQKIPLLPEMVDRGIKQAKEGGNIDFTDMIWVPAYEKLSPKFKYNWIFIDECQDLSKLQLDIVMKSLAPGGRMLFTGDRNQSIYGFSGADPESFNHIQEQTKAKSFPLSVSFRCSKEVIKEAQTIVSDIEHHPGADDGEVCEIYDFNMLETVENGSMILCRLNAPLVSTCLEFIKAGRAVRIKGGKDLCKEILNFLTKAQFKTGSNTRFFKNIESEMDKYIEHLGKTKYKKHKSPEVPLGMMRDYAECIMVFKERMRPSSVSELVQHIKELFRSEDSLIHLSTIHKAKGLENDNVYVVAPEKLPLVWKEQQPWQYYQEMCLKYVAITRAKHNFTYIQTSGEGDNYPTGDEVFKPV